MAFKVFDVNEDSRSVVSDNIDKHYDKQRTTKGVGFTESAALRFYDMRDGLMVVNSPEAGAVEQIVIGGTDYIVNETIRRLDLNNIAEERV